MPCAKEDLFLHVIQVGDQQLSTMGRTELIEEDGICGVKLANGQGTWEVVFHTTGEIGGHISLIGTKAVSRPLTTDVAPQSRLIIQGAPFKIDVNYPGGNVIVEHLDGDTVQLRQDLRDTKGWWF